MIRQRDFPLRDNLRGVSGEQRQAELNKSYQRIISLLNTVLVKNAGSPQ